MEKGDALAFGSAAGFRIDRRKTCGAAARQHVVEIVDGEAQVVDAWATLLDELGDRRSVGRGLKQFHHRFTGSVSCDACSIGIGKRDVGKSEDVAEQGP